MGWYYGNTGYEDTSTLSDYTTPSNAIVLSAPIRAESRRGDIGVEWWGRQWVEAMEHLGLDGRLNRGKRYARNGSVVRLEITHGMVYAEVQGSQRNPYRAAIHLKILSENDWKQALDMLAEQAIYAAKLLAGEMPSDIEAIFQHANLSLFPQTKRDIQFECSCPDWGDPCKHTAAIYYLIAEQLDADPFILFHIRGKTRENILQALRGYDIQAPIEDTTEPEKLDVETFWEQSDIPLIRQRPTILDEPLSFKQLGTPPASTDKELRKIYRTVSDEAKRWLGLA